MVYGIWYPPPPPLEVYMEVYIYGGIYMYGIRYTVICPFLQKMKVLRIAQPGRQQLN